MRSGSLVLLLCLLVPSAFAGDVEYLVPIGPSNTIDAYGAQWKTAVIGYNFSRADVVATCDPACPAFNAREAFHWGSFSPNASPVVLRLPSDRAGDLALEEVVNVVDPSMVQRSSHGFRIPVLPLESITARELNFLGVDPNRFDSRTHIRVFSPMGNDPERIVHLIIYRELEGRSSPIFSKAYSLSEIVTGGVRIAHGVIPWPDAAERPPFPARVELKSDAPIWGFVTITERSDTPAVTVILPAKP